MTLHTEDRQRHRDGHRLGGWGLMAQFPGALSWLASMCSPYTHLWILERRRSESAQEFRVKCPGPLGNWLPIKEEEEGSPDVKRGACGCKLRIWVYLLSRVLGVTHISVWSVEMPSRWASERLPVPIGLLCCHRICMWQNAQIWSLRLDKYIHPGNQSPNLERSITPRKWSSAPFWLNPPTSPSPPPCPFQKETLLWFPITRMVLLF